MTSLKSTILSGSVYLALRQFAGILITVGGSFFLSRVIGAQNLGIYGTAAAFELYLYVVASIGISPYLIRLPENISKNQLHTGFTILFFSSLLCILFSFIISPVISVFTHLPILKIVIPVMVCVLPLSFFNEVSFSIIQRNLNFKQIAIAELLAQLAYYAGAIPCALLKFGFWAPVIGWWSHEIMLVIFGICSTKYLPRFNFDIPEMIKMIKYGSAYAFSNASGMLCSIAAPLLITTFVGPKATGYYTLSFRIVESLGFIREVTRKMSLGVIAEYNRQNKDISSVVKRGMQLQLISIAIPLICFGMIAPWFIPFVIGYEWLPVLQIYPFISIYFCAISVFQLHIAVLNVLGKNLETALFNLLLATIIIGSSVFFLNFTMSVRGYGYALLCGLPSLFLINYFYTRYKSKLSFTLIFFWGLCCAIALCGIIYSPMLYFALFVPLLFKKSRVALAGNIKIVISMIHKRTIT